MRGRTIGGVFRADIEDAFVDVVVVGVVKMTIMEIVDVIAVADS